MFSVRYNAALNHEEIVKHPEWILKIKPFIDKYNWEGINYPSEKDDWTKIKKNNLTIAFNILYAKKIYPTNVSKHKSNHESGEGWNYIAVEELPTLSRGITSKTQLWFLLFELSSFF